MGLFGYSEYEMSTAKLDAELEGKIKGWDAGYEAAERIYKPTAELETRTYTQSLMRAYELGKSSVNRSHGPTYKYQGQTFDCHSKKYSKDLNELFGKYTDDVVDLWNEYDGDLTLKQLQRKVSEFTKKLLKEG